jgi:hypothetical protein
MSWCGMEEHRTWHNDRVSIDLHAEVILFAHQLSTQRARVRWAWSADELSLLRNCCLLRW